MFKFKKVHKVDDESFNKQSTVEKSVVMNMLNILMEDSLHYIGENDVGDKEISEGFNKLIDKLSSEKRQTTLSVNELLNEIIRMNSAREMIKSVTNQTDSLSTMVSGSEELSASIEEVSSISMQVASNTSDTNKDTQAGLQNIQQSMNFVMDSFDSVKRISLEMKKVEEKTEAINGIIDIVKEIADQTNLLALNAAIESARAGEHGKGFAVVADEVKKLAENTKQSTEQVQRNIIDLKKSIDSSANEVKNTSSQLESGKSLMTETMNSITSIGKSIENINGTISEVAANAQEQAAVTETFTSGVVEVSDESNFLMKNCEETALSIFNASRNLDTIRQYLIKNRGYLKDSDMIEIYKTDHLLWKWSIYNMMLGYEKVNIDRARDYKNCALGKWYYGIECNDISELQAFKNMEEPHNRLHQAASDAAIAYQKGDITSAEKSLLQMDEYSNLVFQCLDQIKERL